MAMGFFQGIEHLSNSCPFGFPSGASSAKTYAVLLSFNVLGYLPVFGIFVAIARIAANVFVSRELREPISLGQCGRAVVEFSGLGLFLLPVDILFSLK